MWDPSGFLYVSDETSTRFSVFIRTARKKKSLHSATRTEILSTARHRLIDCASVLRAIIEVTPDGKYKSSRRSATRESASIARMTSSSGRMARFISPIQHSTWLQERNRKFRFRASIDWMTAGTLRLLTRDLAQPNGLAFSPDGKKFYVDDDEKRNIRVYDVAADGTLSHGRIFGEEPGGKGDGVPDGIKVDEKGNLFVTGPKGIWVWDANGNHLGTIVMPEQPANLDLGRSAIRHALHHSDDIGVQAQNKDQAASFLTFNTNRAHWLSAEARS